MTRRTCGYPTPFGLCRNPANPQTGRCHEPTHQGPLPSAVATNRQASNTVDPARVMQQVTGTTEPVVTPKGGFVRADVPAEQMARMGMARHAIMKTGYYSTLIARSPTVFTREIGAACTDSGGVIYFNPDFMDGLTDDELVGVLLHELHHIILQTPLRVAATPGALQQHQHFNVAADFEINEMLRNSGVTLTWDAAYPDQHPYGDEPFPSGLSAEQYFNLILERLPPDMPEEQQDEQFDEESSEEQFGQQFVPDDGEGEGETTGPGNGDEEGDSTGAGTGDSDDGGGESTDGGQDGDGQEQGDGQGDGGSGAGDDAADGQDGGGQGQGGGQDGGQDGESGGGQPSDGSDSGDGADGSGGQGDGEGQQSDGGGSGGGSDGGSGSSDGSGSGGGGGGDGQQSDSGADSSGQGGGGGSQQDSGEQQNGDGSPQKSAGNSDGSSQEPADSGDGTQPPQQGSGGGGGGGQQSGQQQRGQQPGGGGRGGRGSHDHNHGPTGCCSPDDLKRIDDIRQRMIEESTDRELKELGGAVRDISEADIDNLMQQAAAAARKQIASGGRQPGSVPFGLTRAIEESMVPPKVPWTRLLDEQMVANQFSTEQRSQDRHTYRRPDRRWSARAGEIIRRGKEYRQPTIDNVHVVIDTSGSMSHDDLGEALVEVEDIIRRATQANPGAEITVYAVESTVASQHKVRSLQEVKDMLKGGGGTDMMVGVHEAIKNHTESHRPGKSQVIVMTDGHTAWDDEPPPGLDSAIVCMVGAGHAPVESGPDWATTVSCQDT